MKLEELKAGDRVIAHISGCIEPAAQRVVMEIDGNLAVAHGDGTPHFLDGQADEDGELVGISWPDFHGPFRVGARPDFQDGKEVQVIQRLNDGSMIIMGRDAEGFNAPVLHVPMRLQFKRGQAWCTTDPEQEAFAAEVVEHLNSMMGYSDR